MSHVRVGLVLASSLAVGVVGCGDVATQPSDAGRDPDAAPPDAASPDAAPTPDAAVDAPPDMRVAVARYDIGYVDEFTMEWNRTGLVSFLAVVNKGGAPLDLGNVSVIEVKDDNVQIDSRLELSPPSTAVLDPGYAAGQLSVNATSELVVSGLVPEPFINDPLNFRMSFPNKGIPGVDLRAEVTLRIEDAEIVLPFTIHFVNDPVTSLNHAARLHSR